MFLLTDMYFAKDIFFQGNNVFVPLRHFLHKVVHPMTCGETGMIFVYPEYIMLSFGLKAFLFSHYLLSVFLGNF